MEAWNYITIDFDQEMGQEYSTIVQIIVKADRGKAIAWRSVSCKMTCYHKPDEKNSLDSQSAVCTQSAVYILYPLCSLHFVLIGIRGTNAVYFWLQLFAQLTQYTTNTCVRVNSTFSVFPTFSSSFLCKNEDITYNVSSNPPTPQEITLASIAMLT